MWLTGKVLEGVPPKRLVLSWADADRLADQTRGWSPFNYEVTARINRSDRAVGVAFGKIVSLEGDGRCARLRPLMPGACVCL